MKPHKILPALVSSAILLVPLAASAQVTPGDRMFVTGMLQESRDQLALAQLAVRRSTGPEASTAANEAVTEWSSLRSRLMPIAYAQGAPVRGALDLHGRTALWNLGKTPRRNFDVAYLRDAAHGNQTALTRIGQEQGTSDRQLRRFLAYARPVVSSDEQTTTDDLSDRTTRG